MPELSVNSPLGPVTLVEADGAIIELNLRQDYKEERSQLFKYVHAEPTSYFAGQLDNFPLPLNPKKAIFQKRVWKQVVEIPREEALTYGDVAKSFSASPGGGACGRNPIPIITPCHRIIGANDRLAGYTGAGGTRTKSFFLDLESHQTELPLTTILINQKAQHENRRANRPTISWMFYDPHSRQRSHTRLICNRPAAKMGTSD
jgi:methylated-DNA-[protein]-cysteine S-methyltransferase